MTFIEKQSRYQENVSINFIKNIRVGERLCHRDRYLEVQHTEKVETELRNVDRIRITKVTACCPGGPSWGPEEHSSQT
jgi:hypothetical protein